MSNVNATTSAQAPPAYLQPQFDRMPSELTTLKNWVLWAAVWNGAKWTKRPIQTSGYGASTTNRKHWSLFDDVKRAYELAVKRGCMELRERGKPVQEVPVGGVGFVFDGEPGADGLVIAGVDFDKVIPPEGEISSFAAERVKRLGSYVEPSVSGTGLHVILRARSLPRGITHNGTELYTGGRFFTMTGRAPEHAKIKDAPVEFAALVDELQDQANRPASAGSPENREQEADAGTNVWFATLSADEQSEVVKYAALHIASNSKLFELTGNGGNYQDYWRLALAIARSGVENAEVIFVEAASTARDADAEGKLRKFFQNCKCAEPRDDGIKVGTLFHMARQYGANFDAWMYRSQQQQTPTEASFVDPYAEFVGPEFPLDILPPTLAKFVNDEHRAMGADPAAIAMAALTAMAGAMHAETRVRVGDGWWEKPIFWTCLLGQPSSLKSPILTKTTAPLSRIDHGRGKFWRQQYTGWAQGPNKKTMLSPRKPARCVINDATPEKVAELLSRDPSGSLMVHDELAGWLGGFERYNTGQSSRALYLTSWNGGPFLKDRVGKGNTDSDAEVHVDNLALCILGGIQPDRLNELGDLTSDGLLQRFLPVLMKSAKLGDPEYPVEGAEDEYEKLIKSINALPTRNYHFTDEASEVRDDVHGYLHKLEQVDGFPPSLIGAIGKLKGYFARICLVLHIVRANDPQVLSQCSAHFILADAFRDLDPGECLSAGVNVNAAIPRETAEASKQLLLEFLLPHMIGLYDVVVNGGHEREKLRSIANFILASDKDRLLPSDFTAGVRTLRGKPEQKIREWVGRFCSMDWLTPEEGKPGVPTKAWRVSPGLRQHFAEHRKQAQAARAEMHAIMKAGGSRRSR